MPSKRHACVVFHDTVDVKVRRHRCAYTPACTCGPILVALYSRLISEPKSSVPASRYSMGFSTILLGRSCALPLTSHTSLYGWRGPWRYAKTAFDFFSFPARRVRLVGKGHLASGPVALTCPVFSFSFRARHSCAYEAGSVSALYTLALELPINSSQCLC